MEFNDFILFSEDAATESFSEYEYFSKLYVKESLFLKMIINIIKEIKKSNNKYFKNFFIQTPSKSISFNTIIILKIKNIKLLCYNT